MKSKKLNFSALKNALSRNEMKQIMAGSGAGCSFAVCHSDSDCGTACKCAQGATAKFCSDNTH